MRARKRNKERGSVCVWVCVKERVRGCERVRESVCASVLCKKMLLFKKCAVEK